MSNRQTTLNLVADINPDGTPFYESVLVEELGENRYRVLASPGLLEGFAGGDEIELDSEEPLGFRVTRRGGNVCVQFFWKGDLDACARDLGARAAALGGRIDGKADGLLVFTLPVSAGFQAIESIFYEAEKRYADSSWMYANVYDPADGVTPLNWWERD
jgi:hypothetical protein